MVLGSVLDGQEPFRSTLVRPPRAPRAVQDASKNLPRGLQEFKRHQVASGRPLVIDFGPSKETCSFKTNDCELPGLDPGLPQLDPNLTWPQISSQTHKDAAIFPNGFLRIPDEVLMFP